LLKNPSQSYPEKLIRPSRFCREGGLNRPASQGEAGDGSPPFGMIAEVPEKKKGRANFQNSSPKKSGVSF